MRACTNCGAPLPIQTGRGGRRKRCATCSPRRNIPPPARVLPADDGSIETATRAALRAAGRADSPLGRTAILLAARLDSRQDTGAGLAAVSKQLASVLAEAVKDAVITESPLDELRARRRAKLA